MTLLDRHNEFIAALRTAGIALSVAEDIDSAGAVSAIDLLDREQLRAAYAATLVKRQQYRPAFDVLFDLYFPATADDSEAPPPPHDPHRRDDPELARFRDDLAAALLSGDDAELARLARTGVGRFGAVAGARGGSSWSSYAARTRISATTLMARLLAAVRAGDVGAGTGGELAQRGARTMFEHRIVRFGEQLDTEVRRRLAAEGDVDQVARTAVRPSLENLDLQRATRADLVALRREIQPLARRLAARVAIEHRRGRRGPLDMRRTIRSSLSSGGTPMQTQHHPRRPRKTDLVILCDVSESVTSFARFTLLLVFALREQFTRVRVFAFIDDLDEVTRFFRPGRDVGESVAALGREAKVHGSYGRTDYGRALRRFGEQYLDAITARTSLLIIGDARTNYGDPGLASLRKIAEAARRAYWLNPERRTAWDTGDSVAAEMGQVVPMVECRNLAQLSAFVRDLV